MKLKYPYRSSVINPEHLHEHTNILYTDEKGISFFFEEGLALINNHTCMKRVSFYT
jgi:hypothetical protein